MFHSLIKQSGTLETLQLATLGVWLAHCTITGLVPLAQQTWDQQYYLKYWPNIYFDKLVERKLHINWINPSTKRTIIMSKNNNTHWGNCMSLWYTTYNGGTQHFLQDYQTHQNQSRNPACWQGHAIEGVALWRTANIRPANSNQCPSYRVPVYVNNNAEEEKNEHASNIYNTTFTVSVHDSTQRMKVLAQIPAPLLSSAEGSFGQRWTCLIFNILCTQVYGIMSNPQVPCLRINSFIWLRIKSFTLNTMDKRFFEEV